MQKSTLLLASLFLFAVSINASAQSTLMNVIVIIVERMISVWMFFVVLISI